MVANLSNSSSNRPNARSVLASNVVSLRHLKGWSQETLAFEAGLHRTFIAHVERQARNISLDNLERVAVALGIDVYELLVRPPDFNEHGPDSAYQNLQGKT